MTKGSHGLRTDPVHIVVNRKVLGGQLREALYGIPTKCGPRKNIVYWANVVGYWVRRQVLTYTQVRAEGMALAARLSCDAPYGNGSFDEVLDGRLREALMGVLCNLAKGVMEEQTQEERKALKEGTSRKRVHSWMKAALLEGRCPECLQDVSEGDGCGHGYGRPAIDGKGGIVVDPS